MKNASLKLLTQVPLLVDLPESAIEWLAKVARSEQASRGEYIIERNDTSQRLFFLLSGQVRMLDMNRQGQEIALAIIDAPTHFGELAVIDGYPRSAAVQATTRCEVASISVKEAETLIYTIPQVSQRVMKNLAAVIRKNNLHRMVLQQQNIVNRLASYLLGQLPPNLEPEHKVFIRNLPTQYDLGILLGTTRESISRALSQLAEEGLVRKDGKNLVLEDVAGLRSLIDEP
ncbi:Crp/Fnr family transcriptional regulator [Thiothrix winogradskyi]|uniref:Crp/Fnr family transcriptional regulator n=1 Tax=Thiothrix winogradskyi TaxID=96472 RepID=A0ABY3SYZ6_9GAMM|nr:Crp/Fnr family transcriptional regulator [Thiothrix winogradskyi]UJS24340.1 Crp/Fnr family transcriptional regulator [Thiothrix winogradskyi]